MSDTPNTLEPQPAAAAPAAAAAPPPAQPRQGGGGGIVVLLVIVILLLLVGGGGAAAWFLYLPSHPIPALARFLPHPTPAPGTPSAAPVSSPPPALAVQVQPAPPPAVAPAPSAQTAASSSAAIAMSSEPTTTASAAPPVGAPTAVSPQLRQESAGLLVDARRYGLPGDQVGSLAAANGRLNAATPDRADAVAIAMARNEAALLARFAAGRMHEVESTLGGWEGGFGAVADVRHAKGNLDAAIGAVNRARDGAAALAAARRAVAAYAMFGNAYVAATREYVPAQHAHFFAVANHARALGEQIVALAARTEVGLFASNGRREAYQQLQDNAERARRQVGRLDNLAQFEAGEFRPGVLDTNLRQAQDIEHSLDDIYGSSSALYEANK